MDTFRQVAKYYDNLTLIPDVTLFTAIYTISVILYYDCCDHYNIQVYTVIFIDYGICMVTFVTKFYTEGHTLSCIRPMLNFLKMRALFHREQW